MTPRIPDPYDPVLMYHLSDRDFNRRTYYMVLGLYLLVGGSMAAMWFTHFLGF